MSMHDRLDPELAQPLQDFLAATGGGIALDDIPAMRATLRQLNDIMKTLVPPVEGVVSEDRQVPGPEGAPDVPVRIYQPVERSPQLPALLWIHGGGYVLGDIEGDDLRARQFAKDLDCVVVSVEYRLAPEHPFPAPIEDCYAALRWLAATAGELGVDRSRIAIGGASAGGGLAAGLALLARDRGEVPLAFQLLIYPMIDDRNVAPAGEQYPDTLIWSRANNIVGWRSYLGQDGGGDDVSPYAAAFRATDLAGLPPAYVPVGDIDLFIDEDILYAQRLIQAGVPTELHVYPGGFHGFDALAPATGIAQRFNADLNQALRRAFAR